jgi:hypothetical protein
MRKGSLGQIAYILALIGGIILVIQGILSFLGMAFLLFVPSIIGPLGGSYWGIIEIILGIVAIYGARRATDLTWAIILIVVGLIAGGLGGLLVLLGGIVGLVLHFI